MWLARDSFFCQICHLGPREPTQDQFERTVLSYGHTLAAASLHCSFSWKRHISLLATKVGTCTCCPIRTRACRRCGYSVLRLGALWSCDLSEHFSSAVNKYALCAPSYFYHSLRYSPQHYRTCRSMESPQDGRTGVHVSIAEARFRTCSERSVFASTSRRCPSDVPRAMRLAQFLLVLSSNVSMPRTS